MAPRQLSTEVLQDLVELLAVAAAQSPPCVLLYTFSIPLGYNTLQTICPTPVNLSAHGCSLYAKLQAYFVYFSATWGRKQCGLDISWADVSRGDDGVIRIFLKVSSQNPRRYSEIILLRLLLLLSHHSWSFSQGDSSDRPALWVWPHRLPQSALNQQTPKHAQPFSSSLPLSVYECYICYLIKYVT